MKVTQKTTGNQELIDAKMFSGGAVRDVRVSETFSAVFSTKASSLAERVVDIRVVQASQGEGQMEDLRRFWETSAIVGV